MIGAGTVINPIMRILTVVAILAAVYFFIVKPTLDTTNDTLDRAFESVPNAGQLQQSIRDSINTGQVGGVDTNKLLSCVQTAGQDVDKLQRCAKRFGP